MASMEDSIDSNEFSNLQALMLQQSPTTKSQNIGSKLRSPTKKHNQSSAHSQPDGQNRPRSLPNTSAVRKAVDAAPKMTTTVMESPSQQKTSRSHDRNVSFPGFPMDLDGDTQPMPSQIFRDQMRSGMVGLDGNMVTREQNTLQEGEAGHVNLLGDFDDTQAFGNGQDAQSLDGSPVVEDDTQNLLSSMQRQSYPKTPATIGQKRDRQGNAISPSTASKTPGLSAFFGPGQGKPVMTATQLFNMTQADSSPMVDFARSDPIESRPSPNFAHDTSPAFRAESSPTKSAMARPNAPGEPRDHYEPMDKSQKRHWQKIKDAQRSKSSSRVVFDLDEDSMGHRAMRSDPSPHARLATYKQNSRGPPRSTLDVLKERSPLNGLPKTPYTTTMDEAKLSFHSSGSRQRRGEVVEISDDVSEDGSVDAYDELNGDIIPSQRQASQAPDDAAMEEFVGDEGVVDGDTRLDEVGQDEEFEPQQIPRSPERVILNDIHKMRESAPPAGTSSAFLAVADSQPGKPSSQPPMRGIEPSSISSFVPGSQLAPLSSQTRARIADELSQDKSSSLPQPPGMVQLRLPLETQTQTQTQVPSSPPVPESSHRVVDEEEEAGDREQHAAEEGDQGQGDVNNERVNGSAEFKLQLPDIQPEETNHNQETTNDSAAPQLSSNKIVMGPPNSSSNQESSEKDKIQHQSEMTAPSLFETAHTHLSASQASRKSASAISESPRKAAGIRRFGDIALDPTPPDSTKDISIDIPTDFMTEEDHAFLKVVQSPPKRARKALTYGRKANRVAPMKVSHFEPESDPAPKAQVVNPSPSAMAQPEQESSPVRPAMKRRKVGEARNAVTFAEETDAQESEDTGSVAARTMDDTNAEAMNQKPAAVGTISADTSHKDSTNDQTKSAADPIAPEQQEGDDPAEGPGEDALDIDQCDHTPPPTTKPAQTPESVRKREKAGMMAAAEARRALFAAKVIKKAKVRAKRAKVTMPKSSRRNSGAKGRASNHNSDAGAEDIDLASVENDQTTTAPQPIPTGDARNDVDEDETFTDRTDTESRLTSDGEINPASKNRVLAFFRGSPTGYYPATCTGVSGTPDSLKLDVRFDDGSTVVLKQRDVCAFDLKEGDLVKIDDQRFNSKATFIVDGFGPEKDLRKGDPYPLTDVHGQITVAVRERTRESLPTPSPSRHEAIRVPLASVYVVSSYWTKMQERKFMFTGTPAAERSSTPSTSTSNQVTPKSRSRRRESLLGGPCVRAPPSMKPLGNNRLFSNMAFALSYGKEDNERIRITKLISENGGQTLQSGFHELFEASDLPESMPSSPGSRAADSRDGDESPLLLATNAQSLGFVALIAHTYSRSEKYVQALALSLPILHGRWISDSLAAGTPLPWTKYLLPAGESMYLSGAVRSRTLTASPVGDIKLSSTVANREKLLEGGGVLLVVNGKGKEKEKEKARIYAFLSLALGASQVQLVSSALEAKERVDSEEGRWKWVHCDDKSTVAVRRIFAGNGAGMKSNRVEDDAEDVREGEFGLSLGLEKVRIVGDEFVLQSLILGTLIEG